MILAALVAITVALARRIAWSRFLGEGLAFFVGDVLRIRRQHAEAAMALAGIAGPASTARGMYRSLGRGLMELIAVALRPERALHVALPHATITALERAGRGAVVATAHTGNWDLAACAVARRTPLTVVTKRLSVGFLDRLWQGTRRTQGLNLVQAGGAARPVAQALARGELVAMLIDQAPERERGAIRVPFLGAPAWVDLAPALAALRARAPLVVAFSRRLADGTHAVEVVSVLETPARPRRQWAVFAMTEATRLLEDAIRRDPTQWLWMHRRWKGGERVSDAPAPSALIGTRAG